MKIKEVPEGSKIQCNGATAEVLTQGPMGTRVKVLTVPDVNTGFPLGNQIWSNQSVVELITEIHTSGQNNSVGDTLQTKGTILPLTLF